MDNWLESQRGQGELQGQGEFSVSTQEALRKRAEFGMASPEKGILRIVQLLLESGCTQLSIKLARASITLLLPEMPEELVDANNFEEQFLLDSNNFVMALLSCLYSGFRSGHLAAGGVLWNFDRNGFRKAESKDNAALIHLKRNSPVGLVQRMEYWLSHRCLDHLQLTRSLAYSPVPIFLDGRNLSQDVRGTEPLICELIFSGPSSLGSNGIGKLNPRKSMSLTGGTTFRSRFQKAELQYFCSDGAVEQSEPTGEVDLAHLWVYRRPGVIGTISFVYRGVLVGCVQTKFKLPLGGIVSAENLDRDISGLELVQNQKLKVLWDYLKRELESYLEEIRSSELPEDIEQRFIDAERKDFQGNSGGSVGATGAKSMGQLMKSNPGFARDAARVNRGLR